MAKNHSIHDWTITYMLHTTKTLFMKDKVQQFIVALLLFIVLFQIYPPVMKYYNSSSAISNWFVVNQFQVPSIIDRGSEVTLVYDRQILQKFEASWIVEVQEINTNGTTSTVCSGNGKSVYDPEETLPDRKVGVTLDWIIGHNQCRLSDGNYRIYIQWNIDRGIEYNIYEFVRISNVFSIVDPKKSMLLKVLSIHIFWTIA